MGLSFLFDHGARQTHLVERTIPMSASARLNVEARNGTVLITEHAGENLELSARIMRFRGDEQAAGEAIEVAASETDVTVRVHASEEVHLTLKLPRHAHVGRVMSRNGKIEIAVVSGELNATLSNGDMRIERLRGSVTAACGNGRVVVREVATLLSAEVSNGSIEVTLQKTLERDLVLKAGNGQIRLQLPPTPNCELNAHISVGNISTPWRKVAGVGRLQLAEKLGSGGPLVSVTVSVGQIVVTV